jgi:hypothetical protein
MMVMMAMRLLLLLQRSERLLRVAEITRLQVLADLLECLCERPVPLG